MLRASSIDSTAKRSQDEIIREIVRTIDDGRVDEADIRNALEWGYEFHLFSAPGYRRDNEEYAKRLQQWVAKGKRLIEGMPGDLYCTVFGSDKRRDPADDVLQLTANAKALHRALALLQTTCQAIIERPPGVHRGKKVHQNGAVWLAAMLCHEAGKPLAATSPTSAFRVVAGLVCEAVTGQYADLERACKAFAARHPDFRMVALDEILALGRATRTQT